MTLTLCVFPDDRALNEVFKLFDLIHIITTDHKTVARITKEVRAQRYLGVFVLSHTFYPLMYYSSSCGQVIEDFAADNVVYLELRTTPKVYYIFA